MRFTTSRIVAAALIATLSTGPITLSDGVASSAAVPATTSHGQASTYTPYVLANGLVPNPPWWHGRCDGAPNGAYPGSHPIGAVWDGLVACGPGPNQGGTDQWTRFFPGAWGELEWECVELSMRWMYLAWGVPPYSANGAQIVDNYVQYNPSGPALRVVQNGTKGIAPQPGDVLELKFSPGDTFGHTEVVTSSQVNIHGDGTVRVITQNLNSPSNGWYTLTVNNWVVNGGFATVIDWLHNPRWALEEPLIAQVDSAGNLSLRAGGLRSGPVALASGVAQAQVVGGGGSEPAPIIVVLTTSGAVEARYVLPNAPWWQLASSGVTQIAASSGEGTPNRQPVVGWLTSGGDFYIVNKGLASKPLEIASGVTDIALGSNSPMSTALVGYVTRASRAFVSVGGGPFTWMATGVRTLTLAASSQTQMAVEAYVGVAGRGFVRQGLKGPFKEIGPSAPHSVTQVAAAVVGVAATPLVAYVTSTGQAYAEEGSTGWLHESSTAQQVAVAAGLNGSGFPILAVQNSDGSWMAKDGSLSSRFVPEGSSASLALGALVVS
ncbi:MAG: hypothetical protein ACYDGN_13595 [Acidimicrobiales bacterium]